MQLFGFTFGRTSKVEAQVRDHRKSLSPVDNRGGWWPVVRESFAGAWQKNVTVTLEDALQNWAVFTCVKLIASDVAKCRPRLVKQQGIGGIWQEIEDADYSPVLAKPNPKQTRIQFFRSWMESKLTRGNTYVLKQRDSGGRVVALYILDPHRVVPLINEFGDVYYEVLRDDFIGLQGHRIVVPASEIIHDRWNTLYHPLVGLSPIYAAGLSALTSLNIQRNTAKLFKNGARPGGVLKAPNVIEEETAQRLKKDFEELFSGDMMGKLVVLGDGLEYQSMSLDAEEAQLIEQLKWNDTVIFGIYGVPAHMGNAGTAPAYNNVEALNQQYYAQALQSHFEDIELLLDEGLGLDTAGKRRLGTEFDLDDLLRMDTATLVKTAGEGVKNGVYAPDDARRKLGLPPVPGGAAVYLQQQNYSLEALAKRDASPAPFASGGMAPVSPTPDDVRDMIETAVSGQRRIRDGGALVSKDVEPATFEPWRHHIAALVEELVAVELKKLPKPKDFDPESVRHILGELVDDAVAKLPKPKDGKNFDPESVRHVIAELVDHAIAELPKPKDGKDFEPEGVRHLLAEVVEREVPILLSGAVAGAVASIKIPEPEPGMTDAFIDDRGELIVTRSDGTMIRPGLVRGRDGLSFEECDISSDDGGRNIVMRMAGGDREIVRTIKTQMVIYRGVWRAGEYDAGDQVTLKGSAWIAERDTRGRPGDTNSGWRLAIKRGRDARGPRD